MKLNRFCHRTKRSHISAFALIELLFVIAIIAILATILFPVFARARENARRTSCLSNMKQFGLGFMQPSQDYGESLPLARISYNPGTNPHCGPANNSAGTFKLSWRSLIYPYVKSVQVFRRATPLKPSPSLALTPRRL